MEQNKSISPTDLQRAEATKKPPYCHTTEKQYPEKGPPTVEEAHTRVCPYCQSTIPASEDPCHFCDHLEPAVDPNQALPGEKGDQSGCNYVIFMAWVYLLFGSIMIIWPEANPSPEYSCTDDCFLPFVIWSRPGGVISVCISLFILIKAAGWKFPRQR